LEPPLRKFFFALPTPHPTSYPQSGRPIATRWAFGWLSGCASVATIPRSMTETPVLPAHRDQFLSTVVSNTPLCREHFKLVVRVDRFPATNPGQFVQLSCRNPMVEEAIEHEWRPGERPQ